LTYFKEKNELGAYLVTFSPFLAPKTHFLLGILKNRVVDPDPAFLLNPDPDPS
jgi:hypothetical protein